jgi:hypothetical protein
VDKKKVGNKDYVNLSELYFIHSNFSESFKYSDRFLRPLNYRFRSPLDVVAQFYFSASGFLSDNILVNEKMPPQRFRETVQKLPDFTLEGTFASSDLTNYLSSSDFSVTPAKKQEIQLSADCLLDRKKCKI